MFEDVQHVGSRSAFQPVTLRALGYHDSDVCFTLIPLLHVQYKLIFNLMRISLRSNDDE